MITKCAFRDNPYVTLQNKVIIIRCHKKIYRIDVEDINKMYLKKRKGSLFGLILDDNSYNLHIRTGENKETIIRIKAFERQYFLGLISYIRNLKKESLPVRETRRLSTVSGTAAA